MKVIDLLNKIANGEESDTITEFAFGGKVWNFFGFKDSEYCLDEWLLNQEIVITKHKEIIEEDKKIEKITMRAGLVGDIDNKLENLDINIMAVEDKINEIIDYLEENKK